MAVHVVLNRDQIRSILSLYHLDDLEDFGGIAEGSINTSYWVQVDGRKYFLRITEKKRIQDMIFEKEFLSHLAKAGLPVPHILPNVAKGTFTPWSARGRFVSLFEYMVGRELAVFEIRPHHVETIAGFAAQMHVASSGFKRRRVNEFQLSALEKKLDRLLHAREKRRLAKRFEPALRTLTEEMTQQRRRDPSRLPQGTVHGDLFVDNVKFSGRKLAGVIDFEMASTDRLIWELAVLINAWCWLPAPEQHGGPAGAFDADRVRAAIRGYQKHRNLTTPERNALADDLRLAAARFAISRLVDFELKRLPKERRVYKDYRHFMARLAALQDGGAEALLEGGFAD